MLEKYSKVAIINLNKFIPYEDSYQLPQFTLDISLDFTPSRVELIFSTDNLIYPENKSSNKMLGKYGEGYFESISSTKIIFRYLSKNINARGTTLKKIVAIK